jgi:hypothetical protein
VFLIPVFNFFLKKIVQQKWRNKKKQLHVTAPNSAVSFTSGDRPQGLPTFYPPPACLGYGQFEQCESPLLIWLSQCVVFVCSFHPSYRQSLHSIISSTPLTALELPPRASHVDSAPDTG